MIHHLCWLFRQLRPLTTSAMEMVFSLELLIHFRPAVIRSHRMRRTLSGAGGTFARVASSSE
jgi:hypothetical protein